MKLYRIVNSFTEVKKKEILLFLFLLNCLFYGIGNFQGGIPFYMVDLFFFLMLVLVLTVIKHIPYYPFFFIIISYVGVVTFIVNIKLFDIVSVKTYGRFVLYSLTIVTLLFQYKHSPDIIIKVYLFFCKIVSVIALVQFVGILIKIKFLYDYSYLGIPSPRSSFAGVRIASIATEPAWMIQYLIPAFYLSVGRLFFKDKFAMSMISQKFAYFVLFIGVISQSSLFLISLPMLFFLYILRMPFKIVVKYLTVGVIVFYISFQLAYKISVDFSKRIDAVVDLANNSKNSDNWSVFALLSNFYVTQETLKHNTFWGTGIESHRLNYDHYINKLFPNKMILMNLNMNDSGSFYLRAFSEYGLIGVFLLIFVIINRYKKTKKKDYYFFFLSSFLLFIVRNGQYINLQFLLFFWGTIMSPLFRFDENTFPDRDLVNP